MRFLTNPVGKKLIMAVSGFSMIAFVLVHLLGNASIYYGPDGINAYAKALHSFPPLIWAFRVTMLILFSLHVFYGIQLSVENSAAKPEAYAIKKSLSSTFASRNMIWTGVVIAAFLFFHLLHFTFQVIYPEISAINHTDAVGRPDVFTMAVSSFQKPAIASIYLIAIAAVGFHVSHGIQSLFQTCGLNSDSTLPVMQKGSLAVAALFFAAYISIPLAVLVGLLER